jgi:hypothetical protein
VQPFQSASATATASQLYSAYTDSPLRIVFLQRKPAVAACLASRVCTAFAVRHPSGLLEGAVLSITSESSSRRCAPRLSALRIFPLPSRPTAKPPPSSLNAMKGLFGKSSRSQHSLDISAPYPPSALPQGNCTLPDIAVQYLQIPLGRAARHKHGFLLTLLLCFNE